MGNRVAVSKLPSFDESPTLLAFVSGTGSVPLATVGATPAAPNPQEFIPFVSRRTLPGVCSPYFTCMLAMYVAQRLHVPAVSRHFLVSPDMG